MCGRYILVQKLEVLEKRFNVKAEAPELYKPSYNVAPGSTVPVVAQEDPGNLQFMRFGLTPFWASKPMYLFNARAEGDKNQDNDPAYTGANEIHKKPAFRKPIRSQRCLIPADAFIEGSTTRKLDEPYVVYLTERRPFAFAGIWDEWVNKESGEVVRGCAIITTRSNTLLQMIPHHRSPVILEEEQEQTWLNPDLELAHVLSLLHPYRHEKMNAYPISSQIKNPKQNHRELIQPMGQRLAPEKEIRFKQDVFLSGMSNK